MEYVNITGQPKVKQSKKKLDHGNAWMIEEPLSPLLIFAMCKYCKHNVWRQTLFMTSSTTAHHRTELDENHHRELMSAAQIPLLQKDPVSR